MDFLTSPTVIVFLILIFVAIAALKYEPSAFVGQWQVLHDWFGSDSKPLHVSHPQEPVIVSGAVNCDFTVEPDGLWISYDGPPPAKVPPSLFIPWQHFRLKTSAKNDYVYQIKKDMDTRKIVTMIVKAELGQAMQRRIPDRSAST